MRFAAPLIATLVAGCATAPPTAAPPADCAVKVSFGSYGMGVDHKLATGIEAAIRTDSRVAASNRRPWGREGEFDLCLKVKSRASARDVYRALGAMLEGHGAQAPTSVSLATGETLSTPDRP
jgi:hypothetical protein